jgi:pSer/pThr/pTyr-binding forkhead associated (FHA) protein
VTDFPRALRALSAQEVKERLAMAERRAPFLLYREPSGRQHMVALDGDDAITIGRQPASTVSLAWDTAVSRVHAAMERVGEEWTLVDDGSSRNGSFLNGSRCHGRRRLKSGDMIRVGATTLIYIVPNARAASESTAAAISWSAPLLSDAQRRVLIELCRPMLSGRFGTPASNRQIADELIIGVETVKSHLHALFEAFGLQALPQNLKRAELARQAFERGAITEDELMATTRER